MTRREAIAELMLKPWKGDCADLCIAYLRLLGRRARKPMFARKLTVRAVKRVLGSPVRDASFGDILLTRDHLGINLGYAMLTVNHETGEMQREPYEGCLAWSVD